MAEPTARQILLEAADLIEEHGHVVYGYGDTESGFSISGAVIEAVGRYDFDSNLHRLLESEAYDELQKRLGVPSLARWEEQDAEGMYDVIRVLRG